MNETQNKWEREAQVGTDQTIECHDEPDTGAVGALRQHLTSKEGFLEEVMLAVL